MTSVLEPNVPKTRGFINADNFHGDDVAKALKRKRCHKKKVHSEAEAAATDIQIQCQQVVCQKSNHKFGWGLHFLVLSGDACIVDFAACRDAQALDDSYVSHQHGKEMGQLSSTVTGAGQYSTLQNMFVLGRHGVEAFQAWSDIRDGLQDMDNPAYASKSHDVESKVVHDKHISQWQGNFLYRAP
ncbi:hypothetical protein Ancab_026857 [Ancistrocladus abbreviatus]